MHGSIQYGNTPEYLQMIVKYLDKNSTCINKGMNKKTNLICCAVMQKHGLEWFKIIFDLYIKMNEVPSKEDFESALKHERFNEISKECQEMIKENYNKFHEK